MEIAKVEMFPGSIFGGIFSTKSFLFGYPEGIVGIEGGVQGDQAERLLRFTT